MLDCMLHQDLLVGGRVEQGAKGSRTLRKLDETPSSMVSAISVAIEEDWQEGSVVALVKVVGSLSSSPSPSPSSLLAVSLGRALTVSEGEATMTFPITSSQKSHRRFQLPDLLVNYLFACNYKSIELNLLILSPGWFNFYWGGDPPLLREFDWSRSLCISLRIVACRSVFPTLASPHSFTDGKTQGERRDAYKQKRIFAP